MWFENGIVFELAPVYFQALSNSSISFYCALSVPFVSQTPDELPGRIADPGRPRTTPDDNLRQLRLLPEYQ